MRSMVQERGTVIALDYGLQRVGVAKGELDLGLAFPFMVLKNSSLEDLLGKVVEIVEDYKVSLIVVGFPKDLRKENDQNEMSGYVKEFTMNLKELLKGEVVVTVFDEALSTYEAKERFSKQNYKKGKDSLEIDAYAAQIILERYFESLEK